MQDTFWGLFWGYTVFWVLIAAYIWTLGNRLESIERRLSDHKSEEAE